MKNKLKYFIPLIVLLAFLEFTPTVSANYICPTDNSRWPERGDCDLSCSEPCIAEHQNQHRECRNGDCVIVSGPGPDLCQTNETCRGRFCRNNRCELVLAPGPGGVSAAGQCRTDADCVPSQSQAQANPPAGGNQSNPPAGGTGVSIPNPIGPGTFQDLVERIARYLFQIGIPIAVIMILYAAFLYMTAGGSEEKVTKAHKALTYAVVGLAILFLAWGITSLVKELLGGETTTGQPQQEYPSERRYLEQYQQ